MKKRLVLCLGLVLAVSFARADVVLPPVISSHMVLQRDMPVPIWGTAAPHEKVTVKFRDQEKSATACDKGKWLVKLDSLEAGGPDPMTIIAGNTSTLEDVLVGDVWVGAGQSNMELPVCVCMRGDPVLMEMAGKTYPRLRLIRAGNPVWGNDVWNEAIPRNNERGSALLFSFGVALQEALDVPVGLMVGSVSGSPSGIWLSEDALAKDPACQETIAKARKTGSFEQEKRAYEAKIRPFQPFAIRGVLWDQGESGTGIQGIDQYTLMGALIRGWRKEWGQGDFPFIYVQKPSGEGCAWDPTDPVTCLAEKFSPLPKAVPNDGGFVETHVRIMQHPNTAMAISSDLGGGVHPGNKPGYGARAARVALGMVYGKKIEYYGPMFQAATIEGSKIRVTFTHVGQGLAFRHGEALQGFAVAGEDKAFHWADAVIEGDTVVVSCPQVTKPVAVRYAWAINRTWANMFNKDGLPALPFRTDSW